MNILNDEYRLLNTIKNIVLESKSKAIQTTNSILTMMYWEIGNKINQEVLNCSRADYGKSIVVTVSRELQKEFGNSFEEKNLRRMIQFATMFEKEKWGHSRGIK